MILDEVSAQWPDKLPHQRLAGPQWQPTGNPVFAVHTFSPAPDFKENEFKKIVANIFGSLVVCCVAFPTTRQCAVCMGVFLSFAVWCVLRAVDRYAGGCGRVPSRAAQSRCAAALNAVPKGARRSLDAGH